MIELTQTKYGDFYGFSQDHLFNCLKSGEFFDKKLIDYINNNLQEDYICIDAGANIGFFTVLMAKKCKKVYSFEPQEPVFKLLNDNIGLNKLKNVISSSYGLYSENGRFKIADDDKQDDWVGGFGDYDKMKSIGSVSLQPDEGGNIICKRLDSIIDEKIDLIKVDAEGSDIDIIMGAADLIRKYHPKIVFEYKEKQSKEIFGKNMDNLLAFTDGFGYTLNSFGDGNYILE